jgi:hypothetical protein
MSTPLNDTEIASLAKDWFTGLNEHWPLVRMLPLVAQDDLQMIFPEATLNSLPEFEAWYENVIRVFFDQDHIIRKVSPTIRGDEADVKVQVLWKASKWTPPDARSQRIAMLADQAWTVRRSPETGLPVIARYDVQSLEPVSE